MRGTPCGARARAERRSCVRRGRGAGSAAITTHTFPGPIDAIVLRSDGGDVDVVTRDVRAVDARTGSGDVRVVVPRGPYTIAARTDSGDVDVDAIARDERAARSIEAHTGSGDVTLHGR